MQNGFNLKTISTGVFSQKRQKQPPEVFSKKGALKNFANFTRKYPCWSLFLIKLQAFRPATLLKRDSNTGMFLLTLRNFK